MSSARGGLMLVVFLTLVPFTAMRICGRRCRRGAEAALGGLVWSAFLIIAYAMALSSFAWLTREGMTLLAGMGASIALLSTRFARARPASSAEEASHQRTNRRVRVLWTLAGLFPPIAFTLASLVMMPLGPETGHDNLAYHLPRLGYWIQQRAVGAFVANSPRIGSFPPNGNVLQLVPALFLGHDRLCGLVQLVATHACGLAIHAVARSFGASRTASLFAVLGWFAVPSMAAQANLTMVDVTASFFLLAAVYFLMRRPSAPFHLFTSVLAAELAVGTKQHLLVFGVPLALAALVALFRWHRSRLAVATAGLAATALPLGGLFAFQNWIVWGAAGGLPSVQWVVVSPGPASFVKNLGLLLLPLVSVGPRAPQWSYSGKEALTGEGLGLYWIALAGVSLVLLAWDWIVHRTHALRPWLALAGLGLGGTMALLWMLRHQVAVYRFVLPAAGVLTVLLARTFERIAGGRWWRQWALLGLAWSASAWVLGWHGYWHWANRHVRGVWKAEAQRYGADLAPFAVEMDRRSRERPVRVGVVAGQYAAEGLFFGNDYRNTIVPLSYRLPATAAEMDALGLDALWVTTDLGCHVELFRREFHLHGPDRITSWTPTVRAFDRDFLRAHTAAVYDADVRPTLRALVGPNSDWGFVARNARGALFVRGEGRRIGVRRLCEAASK